MSVFIALYSLLFAILTWWRFHWGLTLLFFLLPSYLIRFHIRGLPSTLLEAMTWIILTIWLIQLNIKSKKNFSPQNNIYIPKNELKKTFKKYRIILCLGFTLLIAASLSVWSSSNTVKALGEWKAFYLEPFLIFLVLITSIKTKNQIKQILRALLLSGLLTSILAIYQHFTGWMVPEAFWANRNTFRITAWYGFPNGVGLFLAPLLPIAVYFFQEHWRESRLREKHPKTESTKNIKCSTKNLVWLMFSLTFVFASFLATFYAKSTGGLAGMAGGVGFLLLLHKKTSAWTLTLGMATLVILAILPSSNPIKQELSLQDRSGQIRISIWRETSEFLKDNPILGAGLASYPERIKTYHQTVNGEGIEIFHHPHNIFLTMWINLGLLGLGAFVGILVWFFYKVRSSLSHKPSKDIYDIPLYMGAAMCALIVTGLVDSPYIKNDLALLFWLLPGLLVVSSDHGELVLSQASLDKT